MVIEYFGHSCFEITDGKRTIVFDPFGNIGYEQPRLTADYCVCSHKHYDHFSVEYVDCKQTITSDNCKEFDFLKAVDNFHDECGGKKRGANTVFIYKAEDGTTFCHMGDTGEKVNERLLFEIGKVDILAVPFGGNYTIDYKEALEYCKGIKPKIIIPMHYKTRRGDIDIAGKADFLAAFNKKDIMKADGKITVTVDTLSAIDENNKTIVDFCDDRF